MPTINDKLSLITNIILLMAEQYAHCTLLDTERHCYTIQRIPYR